MVIVINSNELVRFNANPVLSTMSVLTMIPSDSPQLARLNETRAITKYIATVCWRFTATRRRENKRPEAISNGISSIKYEKKNESIEYALSVYSYIGISKQATGVTNAVLPYPVECISFHWVLANVLQQADKVHLPSGKLTHHQLYGKRKEKLTINDLLSDTKSILKRKVVRLQRCKEEHNKDPKSHHLHDPRNGQIRSPLEAEQTSPKQDRHCDIHRSVTSPFQACQSQLPGFWSVLNCQFLRLLSLGKLLNQALHLLPTDLFIPLFTEIDGDDIQREISRVCR